MTSQLNVDDEIIKEQIKWGHSETPPLPINKATSGYSHYQSMQQFIFKLSGLHSIEMSSSIGTKDAFTPTLVGVHHIRTKSS